MTKKSYPKLLKLRSPVEKIILFCSFELLIRALHLVNRTFELANHARELCIAIPY